MGDKLRNYHLVEITGTTDASGDSVDDSPENKLFGLVEAVMVDGTNLTDGADLDLNPVYRDVDGNIILGADIINHEDVGEATLVEVTPRAFEHDIAGADIVAPATYKFTRRFPLFGCSLRVTVANGGNTVAYKVWVLVSV